MGCGASSPEAVAPKKSAGQGATGPQPATAPSPTPVAVASSQVGKPSSSGAKEKEAAKGAAAASTAPAAKEPATGKEGVEHGTAAQVRASMLENPEEMAALPQDNAVTSLAFAPDGEHFAVGLWSGSIGIWSAASAVKVTELTRHSRWCSSLAFSPNGFTLASAAADGAITLWDRATWGVRQHSESVGTPGHNMCVGFSRTGAVLAVGCKYAGSSGRHLRMYDTASWELLDAPEGLSDWVYAVAFSPEEEELLATGSMDGSVRLWRRDERVTAGGQSHVSLWSCCHVLEGHCSFISSLAFSLDGLKLVSASADRTLRVWGVLSNSGTPLITLCGHGSTILSAAVSRGGRVASGSIDGVVRLWNDVGGPHEEHLVLEGQGNWVNCVGFSPDGLMLMSGGWDRNVRRWRLGMSCDS